MFKSPNCSITNELIQEKSLIKEPCFWKLLSDFVVFGASSIFYMSNFGRCLQAVIFLLRGHSFLFVLLISLSRAVVVG